MDAPAPLKILSLKPTGIKDNPTTKIIVPPTIGGINVWTILLKIPV